MQDRDPDHVAGLGEDRHRDHRLELVLVQLRHVLHARVIHRVLGDELRRLRAGDPAGEALVDAEPELPEQVRITLGGGAQDQLVPLQEVDEAGVTGGGVGRDIDDPAQNAVQVQRRGDRLDDGVERLVLELRAAKRLRGLVLDRLHRHEPLLLSRARRGFRALGNPMREAYVLTLL